MFLILLFKKHIAEAKHKGIVGKFLTRLPVQIEVHNGNDNNEDDNNRSSLRQCTLDKEAGQKAVGYTKRCFRKHPTTEAPKQ